jgi:sulfatase modifying factor 1
MRAATLLEVGILTLVAGLGTAAPPSRWTEAVTGIVFVEIPAGGFVMGSPTGEPGRESQERQHRVTISQQFWLGRFEVTQAQWQRVMSANPSHFHSPDGALPVEQVNWYEVHEFLQRLGKLSPGSSFRLPTEAEWEYACRAGTTTAYSTGATLSPKDANVSPARDTRVDARGRTMKVGSFAPNAWGLHDMHGNVWEWTDDDHCPYAGDETDPRATCKSGVKVIRGGSWYFAADSARCALRYTHRPGDRGFSLGFRVVRELVP